MSKYIDLGNKKKIVNPCYKPREDDIIWEGKLSEFDFSGEGLNQKSNYEKINSSLEEFGLVLSYMWVVKYTSDQFLVKYLVKCENKNVFWYKYEARTPGGGNNMLILNGTKIKTTKWIRMSHEERLVALQASGLYD